LEPGHPARTIPASEKLQTDGPGKRILWTKTAAGQRRDLLGPEVVWYNFERRAGTSTRRGLMELARAVVVSGTTIAVAR
jgi:hypothetical protein